MGLFNWGGDRKPNRPQEDSKLIDEAIERITDSDPRLRLTPRYKTQLAPAVEKAFEFAHAVVAGLPPAREANADAWAHDPVIRALFVSPEDLCCAFSRSHSLRRFFDDNPGAQEVHALLGMALHERTTFGVVQQGDSLHHDAPRVTVSFSDHHTRVCTDNEALLREEVARRIIDELGMQGLARIAADQQRRDSLQEDRALLKTRLTLLERRGCGMRSAVSKRAEDDAEQDAVDPLAVAKLRTELEDNAQQLAALGGRTDALKRDLEDICDVLTSPAQYMPISEKHWRLDAMNVVQPADAQQACFDLSLTVAHFAADPSQLRAFTLVRFPRRELRSSTSLLDEAAKGLL